MSEYCSGDTVVCKFTYDGRIVIADDADYEQTHYFDIICKCDNGYLISVPEYIYLRNSFILDKRDCKEFELSDKFIGYNAHYIATKHILSIRNKITGMACNKCKEYFSHAEINRLDENGKGILICWLCRNNRYR